MAQDRTASRRRYSAELKALVVEQCGAPGASVAKVAMAQGVNANVVHRWRRIAREGGALKPVGSREFVPVSVFAPMFAPMSAPVSHPIEQGSADIRIELHRGATTMKVTWPSAAASDCAVWLRELLR